MVGAADHVKILDFGVAKLVDSGVLDPEAPTRMLTEAGRILGTIAYMPPEQLQGRPTDLRSDIFSLGVMLYEMATGRRPFAGDTSADLAAAILRDRPRSVTEVREDLPRPLGRILARCLEKEPGRRYPSALDLRPRPRGPRAHGRREEGPGARFPSRYCPSYRSRT